MERNKHKVSGGGLDLNLWALSRVTFTFNVQAFEILLRMKGAVFTPEHREYSGTIPGKPGCVVEYAE